MPITPTSFLRPANSGCSLTVYASPNAGRTMITGVNEWRKALEIDIAAPPTEDSANEELVRFLTERLSVPAGTVRILRGAKSRLKVVHLPLSAKEAKTRLRVD